MLVFVCIMSQYFSVMYLEPLECTRVQQSAKMSVQRASTDTARICCAREKVECMNKKKFTLPLESYNTTIEPNNIAYFIALSNRNTAFQNMT